MKKGDGNSKFNYLRDRYGLFVLFALMLIVFQLFKSNFLTWNNIGRILVMQSNVGFFAFAALLVLVVNEFDLSLGYLLGLCLMVGGYLSKIGASVWITVGAMLLCGAVCGIINGILIVKSKINSAIVTLATGTIFYGIALAITNGYTVAENIPKALTAFCHGKVFGLTYPFIVIVFIALILYFVLEHTPFGKALYAIGGNERAAHLCGLDTGKLKVITFGIIGVLVSINSIYVLGNSMSAMPTKGPENLMPAYAVVYLSTTIFRPGLFNARGTLAALIILGAGYNGLSMVGVPYWFESIFYGIVLVVSTLVISTEARNLGEK